MRQYDGIPKVWWRIGCAALAIVTFVVAFPAIRPHLRLLRMDTLVVLAVGCGAGLLAGGIHAYMREIRPGPRIAVRTFVSWIVAGAVLFLMLGTPPHLALFSLADVADAFGRQGHRGFALQVGGLDSYVALCRAMFLVVTVRAGVDALRGPLPKHMPWSAPVVGSVPAPAADASATSLWIDPALLRPALRWDAPIGGAEPSEASSPRSMAPAESETGKSDIPKDQTRRRSSGPGATHLEVVRDDADDEPPRRTKAKP